MSIENRRKPVDRRMTAAALAIAGVLMHSEPIIEAAEPKNISASVIEKEKQPTVILHFIFLTEDSPSRGVFFEKVKSLAMEGEDDAGSTWLTVCDGVNFYDGPTSDKAKMKKLLRDFSSLNGDGTFNVVFRGLESAIKDIQTDKTWQGRREIQIHLYLSAKDWKRIVPDKHQLEFKNQHNLKPGAIRVFDVDNSNPNKPNQWKEIDQWPKATTQE